MLFCGSQEAKECDGAVRLWKSKTSKKNKKNAKARNCLRFYHKTCRMPTRIKLIVDHHVDEFCRKLNTINR